MVRMSLAAALHDRDAGLGDLVGCVRRIRCTPYRANTSANRASSCAPIAAVAARRVRMRLRTDLMWHQYLSWWALASVPIHVGSDLFSSVVHEGLRSRALMRRSLRVGDSRQ